MPGREAPPTSGSIRVDDDVVVNATPDEAAQHVMDFAKRAMPASRAIE
jgi:hypothetical protein